MKVVAIIQARMGSMRLPGKVLKDLSGECMLARVVRRTCRAKTLDEVLVATTTQPADDAIAKLCDAQGWTCFRGSEDDVLDRYYQAAAVRQAEAVVRITSDCPLIDPDVIDCVVQAFLDRQPDVDYTSNFVPNRSFPRGLDVQVVRFDALERAWREDKNPAWRADVTYYIDLHPELFHIHNVIHDADYSYLRWTVDTPDDLAFVRRIYDDFGHDRFSWCDVLSLLEEHPEWLEINRHVKQKQDLSASS